MNIESKVRSCYEIVPFPDSLRKAKNFNKELGRTLEWIRLNLNYLSSKLVSSTPHDILCAGCGTGEEAIALSKVFPKSKIAAIDISGPSLKIAKLNSRRARAKNITFKKISIIEDLPRISAKYDFIYSAGVIHHLSEPRKGFRILASKLKTGGQMVVMLYNSYGLFFYIFKFFVLNIISTGNLKLKMFWIRLLKMDKNKSQAYVYDSYINPQVKTFTVEEISSWIKGEKLRLVNIAPPMSFNRLLSYGFRGRKFFFRRQKFLNFVLDFVNQTLGKSAKLEKQDENTSFPIYKTIFFQLLFFFLGKGECQYLIQK